MRIAVVGATGATGRLAVGEALAVGTSRAPTEVYSRGTARLLEAMGVHRVDRLVVVSAAPAGPHDGQPLLTRRLVMPVLGRLFGETYADMRRMEARLAVDEAANWLVLRPPRLVDGPPTGAYRIAATPPPGGGRMTRADLAAAMLDAGERGAPSRTARFVAN